MTIKLSGGFVHPNIDDVSIIDKTGKIIGGVKMIRIKTLVQNYHKCDSCDKLLDVFEYVDIKTNVKWYTCVSCLSTKFDIYIKQR